jgi:hypothetical protein
LSNRVDRQGTGYITRIVPPHAIGNRINSKARQEKQTVLIVPPLSSGIAHPTPKVVFFRAKEAANSFYTLHHVALPGDVYNVYGYYYDLAEDTIVVQKSQRK